MPFLHLDLPIVVVDRARIAGRLARLYAEVMETNPERVTVAFRELGADGILRTGSDGAMEPVVVVQCDIRRGRPAEQRKRLGDAVAALLEDELGWPPARTILEFSEHAGDEVWQSTGLGSDWSPDEAG